MRKEQVKFSLILAMLVVLGQNTPAFSSTDNQSVVLPDTSLISKIGKNAPLSTIVGTGGIGFEGGLDHWLPSAKELPSVIVNDRGFVIKISDGREFIFPSGDTHRDRFFTMWLELHNPNNGYFSKNDIPYHSRETLIVEAPDYGHLTTSEAFSYWVWLEAIYADFTGDFSLVNYAMKIIERYAIPNYQPNITAYRPNSPATFAPEKLDPRLYPVPFDQGVIPGEDPIANELRSEYGANIYSMHWLVDVDNWYGYGRGQEPTMINTFQRGFEESVWETIPHPSIEEFRFGASQAGFLNLFSKDSNGYKRQWRYSNAPDADARVVQAMLRVSMAAKKWQKDAQVLPLIEKARKMGDFLRYSMYDKYFKEIGCQSPYCNPGRGQQSRHSLVAWYYAWGGSYPEDPGSWSWRIGCSHMHFGYQNPVTAYAMSAINDFKPKTRGGSEAWAESLKRQIEFYRWLQSSEGAIAGGATNSLNGEYAAYPQDSANFYGLVYEENPVYHDPGSGGWFGWQAWSMQRVVEYYSYSGDPSVEPLLDRWINWVTKEVQLLPNGDFAIPSTLAWTGKPTTWNPENPSTNQNLHVKVIDTTKDIGVTAALAKTLVQYTDAIYKIKGIKVNGPRQIGQELLARLWNNGRDQHGLSFVEPRADYKRFTDVVPIPDQYVGVMPSGAKIDQKSTFLSLRPQYKDDPNFSYVSQMIGQDKVPEFRYHRFWAQVEAAIAFAESN